MAGAAAVRGALLGKCQASITVTIVSWSVEDSAADFDGLVGAAWDWAARDFWGISV
jgi:hypothetical protein